MRGLLLIGLVTVGCGGGPGFLEGAGFAVADAVFERETLHEGNLEVHNVIVSDAPNLCDRIGSDQLSLAGRSELVIRSFDGGTVEAELREYDRDCELVNAERSAQGWVAIESDGLREIDLDVVLRTAARSVSGRVAASWCTLPSDVRIGCNVAE